MILNKPTRLEIDQLLHPANAFKNPDEVVADPDLTLPDGAVLSLVNKALVNETAVNPSEARYGITDAGREVLSAESSDVKSGVLPKLSGPLAI